MALESGSGIWSLNVSNPATSDDVSQGDDHIRLIKSSLKQTFPLLSATVNVSNGDLNTLQGISSNVQGQFDNLSANLMSQISYGSMRMTNGQTTEFSASTSLSLFTGFDIPGLVGYNTTVKTASGAIAVTNAGHYFAQATLCVSASTAINLAVALYVNDTNTGLQSSTLIPAQGRSSVTVAGDVSMGANDEIRTRILATVAKLIVVKDGQLNVRKLKS